MKHRFADFTLDLGSRRLSRGQQDVHLSRKAFDLLAMLIDHRPSVVEKDELRARLWGATTVVDANLGNLAAEIRAALSDDAQNPRFLRTVHGVGYAFCGTVAAEAKAPGSADGSKLWLVWQGRAIVLTNETNLIGRDPECAIWIDAPGVSRRHARIRVSDVDGRPNAVLEDLDSTNGTFVDGVRLTEPVQLKDGDAVGIGEATLTFRAWADEGPPTKRVKQSRRPRGN